MEVEWGQIEKLENVSPSLLFKPELTPWGSCEPLRDCAHSNNAQQVKSRIGGYRDTISISLPPMWTHERTLGGTNMLLTLLILNNRRLGQHISPPIGSHPVYPEINRLEERRSQVSFSFDLSRRILSINWQRYWSHLALHLASRVSTAFQRICHEGKGERDWGKENW